MAGSRKGHRSSIRYTSDFGRLPKYGKPIYPKPERVDEMYPLKGTGYDQSDVQKGIDKVLGPLSLFAPFTHEDVPDMNPLQLERPITPIDDEIKTQPQTFERMARFVRRRIMAKEDVPYLSNEDQKNLAAIIMGEVNGIWTDISKQIDDPFLSPVENKELNRRIAVHIVTVCEHLFNHYLEKAQVLNGRGVFSGPANMSRLKAQLALEANELLNVLKIRRYIVNDIRAGESHTANVSDRSSPRRHEQRAGITYQSILEASRPKSKHHKSNGYTAEQQIKEIQESMPTLDTSHLMDFISELPERDIQTPSEEGFVVARPSRISEGISRMSGLEEISKQKIILKPESEWSEEEIELLDEIQRCRSQPHLSAGETLLEELGIPEDVREDKLINTEILLLNRERAGMDRVRSDAETKPQLGSRDYISHDLKKLTEKHDDEFPDGDDDDDLPPLIQAITRHARHDGMKQRMEKKLKELDQKQKQREEEECVLIKGPTHPQPDTVSSNLGTRGVVQTSDIRVSERVCMSSITINRFATVYNDLKEEIDPVTVKNLDKNLFLSDEIQEVYKEIMKSVPTKHMELDDDPLVLNAPNSVNVSGTMASASLSKKVAHRVINPTFLKDKKAPWGEADMKDWARTPANPPKNFLGEDIFAPVTPNMTKINEAMHKNDKMTQLMSSIEGMPSVVADKMSRTYASWLQWWKSTLTSDDYMKYLSTLETDYMGAVFHFYDSEDDSESEEEEVNIRSRRFSKYTQSSSKSKLTHEQKERMKKMNELRAIKSEYKEGFWNANAVLMGGLGKDPELAGEVQEDKSEEKSARSSDASKSMSILERSNALRVLPLPEKRDLISRMSKATGFSEIAASSSEIAEDTKKSTPQPQERLEKVWQQLQMPDAQRLDMAIKYSCNDYFSKLTEAIDRWELIAEAVLQRESLLSKLEKFERNASDPNRFFNKDTKKSSKRLQESRQRTGLYKRIDALDVEIKEEVEYMRSRFHDMVTFKGRPYGDKMKWDRTEMLYWLAEERKQQGLQYETITRGLSLPLKPAKLEPISAAKPVS